MLNHEALAFALSVSLSHCQHFFQEFLTVAFSPGNNLPEFISQVLYQHGDSANWEDYDDGWMVKYTHMHALGRLS